MNIAICDDDESSVNQIMQLLKPYQGTMNLSINTYSSGEAFIEKMDEALHNDIVFLDIEKGNISGIEVAQKIREKDSEKIIIFITRHLNYVSDTFRLGAFQFLVKPIDEKAFQCDFERAIKTYKNSHKFYHIRWRDTSYVIECGDIYFIEGYHRHLYVHTESAKYECIGKLPDEEKKLKLYNFVRCHQGYLVNLSKIRELNKDNVILSNYVEIPISRHYRETLLETFNLYLSGRLV